MAHPKVVQTSLDESSQVSAHDHENEKTATVPNERQLPTWRLSCLIISLALGLFLSFMDGSIVSTALYSIGEDFDSLNDTNWVALTYWLSDVGCAAVFTAVSDVTGRFKAWLAAAAIFMAFSFGCGFAQSLDQLIAFRTLQGLGGSGLYTLGIIIWQEATTARQKLWMGAAIGLVVALAGVLGPVLGGVLAEKATWRWIFWLNAPVVVVATVLFIVAWPRNNEIAQRLDIKSIRKFDFIGSFLLIAGTVLPVFAFQEHGATRNSWSNALFLAPLLTGVASWVLLVSWQIYVAARPGLVNPVLPLSLLRQRRFSAVLMNSLLMGFGLFVVIYQIPLRLQIVNGKSPLQGGLGLLTMLCCTAVATFVGPGFSTSKDYLGQTLIAGSIFMTVGLALLSTLSEQVHVQSKMYGFQVLVGLGFGLLVSAHSIVVNVECKTEDHAVGQGLVAQARVLGGTLGLAATEAILGQKIQDILSGIVPDIKTWQITTQGLTPTALGAVRHTQAVAFREDMWVATAMLCGAFLAACFAWNSSKIPFPIRLAHSDEDIGKQQPEGTGPVDENR